MLENIINIIKSYKKAGEFCSLMAQYESNGTKFNDVMDDEVYQAFENWTIESRKNFPKSLGIGSIAYFIRHPLNTAAAQKYYHYDFGKPCPINNQQQD